MSISPSHFSLISVVVAEAGKSLEGCRRQDIRACGCSPGKVLFDQGSMFLGGSGGISSVWRSFLVGLPGKCELRMMLGEGLDWEVLFKGMDTGWHVDPRAAPRLPKYCCSAGGAEWVE